MLAVPDGLEQSVGEAEGQDVLGRLLAQEVVDPEDLVVVEDLVDHARSAAGPLGRSVPNGFSMMIRARSVSPASPRVLDHGVGGVGRNAQVVQPPGLAAERRLGVLDRLGQAVGPGRPGHVADAVAELAATRSSVTSPRANSSQAARARSWYW